MKKVISIILLSVFALVIFSSCNMSCGLGNYKFTKVHIHMGEYNRCVEIEKWYDNQIGLEVRTKEFGPMFLSEGTYALIQDSCPICDGED